MLDLSNQEKLLEEARAINENSSLEDIEKHLAKMKKLSNDMNNMQLGIKIMINSVYGATAAPYFIGYNPRIAEAITLQGQKTIKFASDSMEQYFKKLWPIDKKVHKALGIKKPGEVKDSVTRYGDTDSTYITFQEAFYNTEWEDPDNHVDGLHFITKLYELRLEDFLNSQFEKYAVQWNTKNLQNFELETISKTMILIAKKRYVGDMVYKDGIEIESMKHIKLTGVELVQSSTPTFARQELLNIVKKFLLEGKNMDYRQFVLELKDLKKKFMTADMNDICFGSAVNNIEKGFTITHKGDDIELEFNLGCPIHVKASGRYNYTLMGSEFKKKYSLIRSGDKIKYYYMKSDDPKNPAAFAFLPGSFPYEIAPEVDYDVMFEKAIINPVNRFLEPMGFPPIPGNLVVMRQLF